MRQKLKQQQQQPLSFDSTTNQIDCKPVNSEQALVLVNELAREAWKNANEPHEGGATFRPVGR